VIFDSAVLMHRVCALLPADDVSVIVLFGFRVIVPVVLMFPQPPINVTEYV